MRVALWMLIACCCVSSNSCSPQGTPGQSRPGEDEQSRRDHAALQGRWQVVAAESNGEPPPAGMLDGAEFDFVGGALILMGKEGRFTLNAAVSPRQIEFVRGTSRQSGIYELNGDDLKLCVGPTDDRPRDFTTKPLTDHSVFVLKRKK